MKNYAVLGAGLMGQVIVKDLLETESDAGVTLINANEKVLKVVDESIKQDGLKTYQLDITATEAAVQLLE
ncbi:MAG: hypothetical protein JSW07_02420 [bacterium]|nr:MAG: hypothetical protein JSW07_02420 [bacterium]